MQDFFQMIMSQSEWDMFKGQWLTIGFKIVLAVICGGIIGLERELKHKPAGLRTNILICLGSVLFTTLSVLISQSMPLGHPGDPGRIAAQVVTGIGFLGGGMIIQSGSSVIGLTSAATVWVVAAIGLCIGLGYPITAFIFTITVFCTLFFLSKVDTRLLGKSHKYKVEVELQSPDANQRSMVMTLFQRIDLELQEFHVQDENGRVKVQVSYFASEQRHLQLQAQLWSCPATVKADVQVR